MQTQKKIVKGNVNNYNNVTLKPNITSNPSHPNTPLHALDTSSKIQESSEDTKKVDEIIIDEDHKEAFNVEEVKKYNQGITYNLDDIELKKINLDKNVCIRIINNVNGTFVDIRKYYKGYPTKRGIRFSTYMFRKIIELLKDDIKI